MGCLQRCLTCGKVTEGKKSTLNVGIPSIRLGAQMEEGRSSKGQLIQASSVIPRQVCLLLDTQCQTSTIASHSVSAVCRGCHGHSVTDVYHCYSSPQSLSISCLSWLSFSIIHRHSVPTSSGFQCRLKLSKLSESFVDFRIRLGNSVF